jgi:hypothetical protein
MVPRFRIELSPAQVAELSFIRGRHPKPYVRERAAAILKLHAGEHIEDIATTGLLKRHEPETVSGWAKRYLAEGARGLLVKPGQGRKPSFSPSVQHGGGGSRRSAGGHRPTARRLRSDQ